MNPVEPPPVVNPDAVRRSPDGRIALHFPESNGSVPSSSWLLMAVRGGLYVEVLTDQDVADWDEMRLP